MKKKHNLLSSLSFKVIVFSFFWIGSPSFLFSENKPLTIIKGKVYDNKTKEPMPFVNVYFQGTTIGGLTNKNGEFSFSTLWAKEKLVVSFIGYTEKNINIKIGETQKVNVFLESEAIDLAEVEIVAKKRVRRKENPAIPIIMQAVRNRKKTHISSLDAYEYDKHTSINYALTNITEENRKKGLFKQFPEFLNHIDTSNVTGKPYIPFFFTENVEKNIYRKEPKKIKKILLAKKQSGLNYPVLNEMLQAIYHDYDLRKAHIHMLGKDFVNPVSFTGQLNYKYLLMDSLLIKDEKYYKILFTPIREEDFTFSGEVLISKKAFFVKKIMLNIPRAVNINFVNSLRIEQEYEQLNDSISYLLHETVDGDFSLNEKINGFSSTKKTSILNFTTNSVLPLGEDKNKNDYVEPSEFKT